MVYDEIIRIYNYQRTYSVLEMQCIFFRSRMPTLHLYRIIVQEYNCELWLI